MKNLEKILVIPSKSRYELELEKYKGDEAALKASFSSEIVWNRIKESHLAQKANIKRIAEVLGQDSVIERSLLTEQKIQDYDAFVIAGGDNHFTYCAQQILNYERAHQKEKYVIGTVLDPTKSTGALLYFTTEKLLNSISKLRRGQFSVENWTVLEAKIDNGAHKIIPYPAIAEYFIGERERLDMSRNIALLNHKEIFPEKSSGLLVVTGIGSSAGSWYNNVHQDMFNITDEIGKNEGIARIIVTESGSRIKPVTLKKGDMFEVHSYNDYAGVISPDSQRERTIQFPMGSKAEIWISDLKLKVVKYDGN